MQLSGIIKAAYKETGIHPTAAVRPSVKRNSQCTVVALAKKHGYKNPAICAALGVKTIQGHMETISAALESRESNFELNQILHRIGFIWCRKYTDYLPFLVDIFGGHPENEWDGIMPFTGAEIAHAKELCIGDTVISRFLGIGRSSVRFHYLKHLKKQNTNDRGNSANGNK